MEEQNRFLCVPVAVAIAVIAMISPIDAQSSSTCTGAMMRSLSPCVGFLYGGSGGSSPTSECCGALRNLMSTGQDCLCLFVAGGTPFKVPINNSLAMSLPRACKMSGVPIECKATASPVPSPDAQNSGQGGSNVSPRLSPPSPTGQIVPEVPPADVINTPPAPDDLVPTLTPPGMRPTLTLSAATHPCSHITYLPSLLLASLGIIISF